MWAVGALLLAGLVGLTGCATGPPAPVAGEPTVRVPATLPPLLTPAPLVSVTAEPAAFRRLLPAALATELATGRVLLLDVRLPEDFAVRHIPGAVSFPLTTAATHLAELPHDRPLVAYCG